MFAAKVSSKATVALNVLFEVYQNNSMYKNMYM